MSNLFARPTHFTAIDSTNRYLIDRARLGDPEGGVAIADSQSDGRGRLGRSWASVPHSSLLCSMLFRPSLEIEDFHLVMTIVALSARDAIDELAGVEVSLKWPNDLLVDEAKVAGLLAEIVETDLGHALIVGIGINIQWPGDEAPSELAPSESGAATRATTLYEASGQLVDRDLLAQSMLENISCDYRLLGDRSFHLELMQRYRDALGTIGRRVRVEQRGRSYEAEAIGVTDAGRLQVQEGGVVRELDAADVIHLRH
ncbi:MAG TPA: biotin--[acetyl-CoA-carboxylase] ligase [Acidimicrobiales bacterium]|nr:biotin--[acetyl-CoA-carboxylase] ligase [Acidimicrobiales bacterium]